MSKPTTGPYTCCFTLHDGDAYGFDITAPPWGSVHPIASYYAEPSKARRVERTPEEIRATGNLFANSWDLLALAKTAEHVCRSTSHYANALPEDVVKLLEDTARLCRLNIRAIEGNAPPALKVVKPE